MRVHSLFALILAISLCALNLPATSYSIIIPVKARGAGPLYRIKRDNKWGFINREGKVVIRPQFAAANDFFDGLAAVRIVNAWGYVRESGAIAIPAIYDSASDFKEQRAVVCRDDLCGVIDPSGNLLTRLEYSEVKPFSEGFAAVWVGAKETPFGGNAVLRHAGKWGFIDRSGTIVIEPQFDWAEGFSRGRAAVGVGGKRDKSGDIFTMDGARWGFIDTRGEITIPAQFEEVETFEEEVAAVWNDSQHWLIDLRGKQIAGPYKDLGRFADGLACIQDLEGLAFIRPDGTTRVRSDSWDFGEFSCFERNVIFAEGLAVVAQEKKYGFIDTDGKVRIPFRFSHAATFSEDLASAQRDAGGPSGFIDKVGNWVIPPRFKAAEPFVDGLALVMTDEGRWDYIDRTGKTVARDVFHY
jgi:hypothetical protein